MTNTLLAQVLSFFSFLMPPASADEVADERGRHGKGAGLCERLECTEEQRAAIDEIRDELRQERADAHAEAKRLHDALAAEERKPNPDPQVIAGLRAQLDAHRAMRKQAKADAKAEIAAVLTPEQRERLGAMKAKRERGEGKGKAHAKRESGEGKGKAHAKGERGEGKGKGKAHAKRERGGEAVFRAG